MTDPVVPVAPRYFEVSKHELENLRSSDFLWSCFLRMRNVIPSRSLTGENLVWLWRDEFDRLLAAAAPVPCAASPADLGKLRTEIGTVLKQVELTTHRADALPPATYSERPTITDWRERVTWLVDVLNATWKALELEHLAQLRTAAKWSADKGQLLAVVERWNDRLEAWQNSDTEGYDALIAITCDIARESHHILNSDPLRATQTARAVESCADCERARPFADMCSQHFAEAIGTPPRATGEGARDAEQAEEGRNRATGAADEDPQRVAGGAGDSGRSARCSGAGDAPLGTRHTGTAVHDDDGAAGNRHRGQSDRGRDTEDQASQASTETAAPPVAVSLDPHRLQHELLEALKSEGQKDVWIKMLSDSLRNVAIGCCELPEDWEGSVADALDLIQQRLTRDDLELARLRGEATVRVEE